MKIKLTQEQIENMSYADVAFLLLNSGSKKVKIQELFKKVLKSMELPEDDFNKGIGDFFELLLIDKRFIMLEDGFCDLKINHSTKIVFDDDEDEEIDLVDANDEETEEVEDTEINYDEDTVEDDTEDELEDLIILDDSEDNDML